MEFQTSFKNIWNVAPVAGKALIVVAAAALIVATVFMFIYGPKN